MKILGIDSGTEKSGWCIYNTTNHSIEDKGIDENKELLNKLSKLDYDVAALEMVASYGMAVGKTTFETVYWIGRFAQKINEKGTSFHRYYKKTDINPAICFNARANDSTIRRAILDMFPKTGGGKEPSVGVKANRGELFGVNSHMIPALAVALTHALKTNIIKYKRY